MHLIAISVIHAHLIAIIGPKVHSIAILGPKVHSITTFGPKVHSITIKIARVPFVGLIPARKNGFVKTKEQLTHPRPAKRRARG